VEITVQGRVIEAGERTVDVRQRAAEVLQQRRRRISDVAECDAVDVRDEADEVAARLADVGAGEGGDQARRAAGGSERAQGGVFCVEHGAGLGGVGDLEDAARAVGGAQAEILIALAGQRLGFGVQAEERVGEGGGVVE